MLCVLFWFIKYNRFMGIVIIVAESSLCPGSFTISLVKQQSVQQDDKEEWVYQQVNSDKGKGCLEHWYLAELTIHTMPGFPTTT